MLIWVGRSVTTLMVVILTLTHLKVTASAININKSVHNNEVLPGTEHETHPHNLSTKPTKFDLDVTKMTMTDDKTLFEKEFNELNATNTKVTEHRCTQNYSSNCIKANLEDFMNAMYDSNVDIYNVTDSIQIIKNPVRTKSAALIESKTDISMIERIKRFASNYALKIKLPTDLFSARTARTFFGAFGLKKLLLPLILGVQIIKSILIALFLPSIIGSIGKIVGKGVSTFAHSSQSATVQPDETFEFKDQEYYNEDYMTHQPPGTLPASAMYDESMLQKNQEIASRFGYADRYPHMNTLSDKYYTRYLGGHAKKQDFKNFHEIPSSSLLLTNYDPFYSPLLSRLDAVFSRLGHTTEGCREYAVCAMYRTPARFAPFSNLVSVQLSQELNELRKPSSDNPDVLRFFRYMKAAKDGQDGKNCETDYKDCAMAREDQSLKQNQAMLATYQDIDKLVRARKL